jgi:class 3 adenylate cyclase/CHASE2 domain-containing sensor protein
MAENWLSDLRIATLLPAMPQSADVVIVTVTDDTLRRFPYREPVDRHFLAQVLKKLDADGAKAIGIDYLFDHPTEAEKDAELAATLRSLRTPLVIGTIGIDQGLNDDQQTFLEQFVPPGQRAPATLLKDDFDKTVRRLYPGRAGPDGTFRPSFPLALARHVRPDIDGQAATIAWHGAPAKNIPPFKKFPAESVTILPPAFFQDKIVLIGADVTLRDRFRTPFAAIESGYALMPGIEIHAHALSQLLDGRKAHDANLLERLLLAITVATVGVGLAKLGVGLATKVGIATVLAGAFIVGGFALFHQRQVMMPLILPILALGGSWWAGEIEGGRAARRQRQFLKDAFSRYMSPSLVDALVADPGKLVLGGERREMTFLFTDVAGFTTLSESIDPAALGSLLNDYFNGICHIIMDEGGTVVDFIGDAVFAVFGAPLPQADHAKRAIACALRIDAYSATFREGPQAKPWQWGETRIGVHTGFALVGNFGSDLKFKYAAVGDAVNTGARLEGLNKVFGTRICLSESAVAAAGWTACRPLGRFVLKGKSVPLGVFEPVAADWLGGDIGKNYLAAYQLMTERRIPESLAILMQLKGAGVTEPCVLFHAELLKFGGRRTGEDSDIIVMQTK